MGIVMEQAYLNGVIEMVMKREGITEDTKKANFIKAVDVLVTRIEIDIIGDVERLSKRHEAV